MNNSRVAEEELCTFQKELCFPHWCNTAGKRSLATKLPPKLATAEGCKPPTRQAGGFTASLCCNTRSVARPPCFAHFCNLADNKI